MVKDGEVRPVVIVNIKRFIPRIELAYAAEMLRISEYYNGNVTFILKVEKVEELIASQQLERDILSELKEELKKYLPDTSADLSSFLNSISQILYKYIAHKYDAETAGLTKDEITALLKEKSADERIINNVGDFIEKSDVYRFSGAGIELSEYEQLYSLLESVIE